MAWCYEIRGAENRLIDVRSGFATEDKAAHAGPKARCHHEAACPHILMQPNDEGSALALPAPVRPAPARFSARASRNLRSSASRLEGFASKMASGSGDCDCGNPM